MSRPPMKAVEQLSNYCDKTQMCDSCAFSYKVYNDHGFYIHYKCYLNELRPDQWGQIRFKKAKRKAEEQGL